MRRRRKFLDGPPITSDHPLLAGFAGRSPRRGPRVFVFTHDFDVGDLDPSNITDLERFTWRLLPALEPTTNKGCYYVNPLHTVTCPAPTAEFFREAHWARSSWLRRFRQTTGNFGFRERARSLSPNRRQVTLTGVLFIDGELVDPATWNRQANDLLHPDAPHITVVRRPVDLSALKASGSTAALEDQSRVALRDHLANAPDHAAYVTPLATVSAPAPSEAFYLRANKHKAEWCVLLRRRLGLSTHRRLRREADPRTLTLALSGALVVSGQLYLPGCWPNQDPKPRLLKRTPFGTPTVPPDYLGLDLPSSD